MNDQKDEDKAVQMPNFASQRLAPVDLGANTSIGKRLKAYYDDVASEPVPDRFLALLDALDAVEISSKPFDSK